MKQLRTKYRIVEGFTKDGFRYFRPEYQFLWVLWLSWTWGFDSEVKFETLEEAQEFIDLSVKKRVYPYQPNLSEILKGMQ